MSRLTSAGPTRRAGDRVPKANARKKKSPEPRNHHFVAQFHLAGFTSTGTRDDLLWVAVGLRSSPTTTMADAAKRGSDHPRPLPPDGRAARSRGGALHARNHVRPSNPTDRRETSATKSRRQNLSRQLRRASAPPQSPVPGDAPAARRSGRAVRAGGSDRILRAVGAHLEPGSGQADLP